MGHKREMTQASNGDAARPANGMPASSAKVRAEAADWFERVNMGEMSEAERAQFVDWLNSDPMHAKAYQTLEQTWLDLPLLDEAQARAEQDPGQGAGVVIQFRRLAARPAALTGLAAALLLTGFLALIPFRADFSPAGPAEEMIYVTGTGETRNILLADGSSVHLTGETTIETAFDDTSRQVTLTRGAAYFDVQRDESRPFIVEADAARITVLGTEFEVWRGAGEVRVSVREGRVETAALDLDSEAVTGRRTLARGQRLVVSDQGRLGEIMIIDPDDALALRDGRFIYDDARLSTVIADINRFRRSKVRLESEAMAQQRVTAAFQADGIGGFLQTLALVEGYAIEEGAEETVISGGE